jgi:hypothetical protein
MKQQLTQEMKPDVSHFKMNEAKYRQPNDFFDIDLDLEDSPSQMEFFDKIKGMQKESLNDFQSMPTCNYL